MSKWEMLNEETFFIENFSVDTIFRTIERADYFFLYYINLYQSHCEDGEKVYLSELSGMTGIKIPELSKAMEKLLDKGYILWETDTAAGKTYVELTSKAIELMREQRQRMEKGYRLLLDELGKEELKKTVQSMKRIYTIIAQIDDDD